MTKRTNGAATAAPRPRSGMHVDPRVQFSVPRAALALWRRAAEHAGDRVFAEWLRAALTLRAADELGLDPTEALAVLGAEKACKP